MDTRSSSATRLAQPPTSSSSFSTGGVSDRVSRLISYQRSGRVIFEVAQCPSADLHPMIIRPTLRGRRCCDGLPYWTTAVITRLCTGHRHT